MTVYVVTWNLNNEKNNYDAKHRKLFEVFSNFDRYRQGDLDSVIFLDSVLSAHQLNNVILSVLDANDTLFVSRVNRGEYNGWLEQAAWDWINARV